MPSNLFIPSIAMQKQSRCRSPSLIPRRSLRQMGQASCQGQSLLLLIRFFLMGQWPEILLMGRSPGVLLTGHLAGDLLMGRLRWGRGRPTMVQVPRQG